MIALANVFDSWVTGVVVVEEVELWLGKELPEYEEASLLKSKVRVGVLAADKAPLASFLALDDDDDALALVVAVVEEAAVVLAAASLLDLLPLDGRDEVGVDGAALAWSAASCTFWTAATTLWCALPLVTSVMIFLHLFLQVSDGLLFILYETVLQRVPCVLTNEINNKSSSTSQPLSLSSVIEGSSTSMYRLAHWSSVLPGISSATFCHEGP